MLTINMRRFSNRIWLF